LLYPLITLHFTRSVCYNLRLFCLGGSFFDEAYVSAKCPASHEDTRLSQENEEQRRPQCPQAPSTQGARSPRRDRDELGRTSMLPRSGREFRATYSRSQSFATPRLTLYLRGYRPTGTPSQGELTGQVGSVRVGFSISKKAARKAHERNLIKRRLREIVRHRVLSRVRSGRFDAVIVARSPALEATFDQLTRDTEYLFSKSGVLLSS